jgi:hypothetical protein
VKWTTWISRRPCIRSNGLGFFPGHAFSLHISAPARGPGPLAGQRPHLTEAARSRHRRLETFWLACMALKKESMGLPGLVNTANRVLVPVPVVCVLPGVVPWSLGALRPAEQNAAQVQHQEGGR